ncbi:hypothetical protein LTS09_016200 [Friedmanniomyces endolithicus]|nr:hypothetical protein LTS09_016200 [Friedmanniomyces endolithicus]
MGLAFFKHQTDNQGTRASFINEQRKAGNRIAVSQPCDSISNHQQSDQRAPRRRHHVLPPKRLLVFLSSCSPLYVVLFLATNYWLQRPCVYCSILLFVLCASLIDFKADWFEPRWQPSMESSLSASETLPSFISGNATVTDAVLETASLAISALNGTGGSLVSAAMNSAKRRVGGGASNSSGSATLDFFSVVKSAMEKWQVRIPCLGVVVRL